MEKVNEHVKEVFSLLTDFCIPSIYITIKKDLILFLEKVVQGMVDQKVSDWINALSEIDIDQIEKKHDKLNINLLKITYMFYDEWVLYFYDLSKQEIILNFKMNEDYFSLSHELFITCILNEKILMYYKNLEMINLKKEKLLSTKNTVLNTLSKEKHYFPSIINEFDSFELDDHIKNIYEKLKKKCDAYENKYEIIEFIETYQQLCLDIINNFKYIDSIYNDLVDCYLEQCMEVFGGNIENIYQIMTDKEIDIDFDEVKTYMNNRIKEFFE